MLRSRSSPLLFEIWGYQFDSLARLLHGSLLPSIPPQQRSTLSFQVSVDELETQKNELKAALAAAKLKENLGLKKEHILFFLYQFADMDLKDIDCQKRLIKTFINSVFVYDDKVILTFNYSSDQRTITLNEINGGLQEGVRISPSDVHQ